MKKILFIMIAVLVILPFAVFAAGQGEAKETEQEPVMFKLSHSYETSTAFHTGAIWAAEEIKKRTDGRYTIDVFPSGTLGTEREVEEALTIGTVDLAFVGPGHMGQTYAPITIHLAAFLWRDIDHFLKYPESNTYKEVTTEYMKLSGNQILALTYFGQRHVTSNTPLHTPEDFKGLKMRVPPVPIYMMFPEAVGANSTPINFSELYLALQQGVVVAQENPLTTIQAKKFHEVQDYIILTGHMTDGFYTLAGDHVWSKLSDTDAEIFTKVFKEAALKTTNEILKNEKNLAQWFRDQGTEVIEVDRSLFIDAVAGSMTGDDLPWTQVQIEELKGL
jgi:tripartite ATP-independent transporter DctP family solute receptor